MYVIECLHEGHIIIYNNLLAIEFFGMSSDIYTVLYTGLSGSDIIQCNHN